MGGGCKLNSFDPYASKGVWFQLVINVELNAVSILPFKINLRPPTARIRVKERYGEMKKKASVAVAAVHSFRGAASLHNRASAAQQQQQQHQQQAIPEEEASDILGDAAKLVEVDAAASSSYVKDPKLRWGGVQVELV